MTSGMSERKDGWHQYWRENRLAACVPENPASAAAIEACWLEFFSALADGSRVLDIATGNGVLLVWADRVGRRTGRKFHLTGIDSADIDPLRFLPDHQNELSAAAFFGNTSAEALPFADASFDVVVSQYGLEYAELSSGLTEAARVLKTSGQLHWLAHGEDSVVVAQGREQLSAIDMLLADKGPFATMKAFVDANTSGRKVKQALEQLTESLRAAQAYCETHPPATLAQQLCGGILDTTNNVEKYRPEDVLQWLSDNRDRLVGQKQRVLDLQAARLVPDRLAAVNKTLGRHPWTEFHSTSLALGDDRQSVGQLLRARKA